MIHLSIFRSLTGSLAILAFLQLEAAAQTNLVLRAGPNYSDIVSYKSNPEAFDLISAQDMAGFHLGFGLQKSFSKKWAFELDMLYTGKGIEVRNFFFNTSNQRFSYLSAPVSVVYKPIREIGLRAGLEMSYLLNSESTNSLGIPDQDHKFDLGYVAGLTFYPASKWSIEFRFVRGLTPLSILSISDLFGGIESEFKWYNQVLQLSGTFLLGGPGN